MTSASVDIHLQRAARADARSRVEFHLAEALLSWPGEVVALCRSAGLTRDDLQTSFCLGVFLAVEVFERETSLAAGLVRALAEPGVEPFIVRRIALGRLVRANLRRRNLWERFEVEVKAAIARGLASPFDARQSRIVEASIAALVNPENKHA